MTPKLFALLAVILYALQNVVIQRKLSQASAVANMAYFYIPIIIFSWAILIFRNQLKLELTLPNVSQFWWLIFIGVTLFVADFCLFTAYKNGGSVVGITILTGTLFPIFASLINVSTGGGWPKWNEVVGYCFAAVAVVFVSLGGKH